MLLLDLRGRGSTFHFQLARDRKVLQFDEAKLRVLLLVTCCRSVLFRIDDWLHSIDKISSSVDCGNALATLIWENNCKFSYLFCYCFKYIILL